MKIRIITPVVTHIVPTEDLLAAVSEEGAGAITIDRVTVERGPTSIESEFDEALAVPDVLNKIREAEQEGCDAVVVSCFLDPGVAAGRELVAIPVVGPGEAAMHLAALLGLRFSVVTVLDEIVAAIHRRCWAAGLGSRLASVRAIDTPVLELHTDQQGLVVSLVEQCIKAVKEDDAHALVLGCTGVTGLARAVQLELSAKGYEIPIVDPLVAAVKVARTLVEMGLSHSKRTFPYPRQKEIRGYAITS